MACLDANQAVDFVDGRTPEPTRGAVIAHIAACSACRRMVAELGRSPSFAMDDTHAAGDTPPASRDEAPPATTIGRFEIRGVLGRGGMGLVYEAHDPELGRAVAVKVLRSRGDHADERGARLVREARALAQLSHPHIVGVYDAGISGGDVYIALELVRGATLRDWLASEKPTREQILDHLGAIGDALATAHDANLVHRDVKPDNILVGNDGRARLADFGLVTASGAATGGGRRDAEISSDLTATGAILGTPAFMAPEQHDGAAVDARTDQFAFCVTACDMLSGERLIVGRTPTELAAAARSTLVIPDEIPRRIARVLARGLSRHPGDRYPDMRMLLADLARARRPPRWRRWAIGGALAAAIATTAAVAATRFGGAAAASPCEDAPARLAVIWRAELRDRMAANHASSPTEVAKLAGALDAWSEEWVAMRTSACRATLDGGQSEALLDARMRCLDRGLAGVGAFVEAVANGRDLRELDAAVDHAPRRDDLAVCSDLEALKRAVPLPENAVARSEVVRIDGEIAAIQNVYFLGRSQEAARRAHSVIASARAVAFEPVLGRALLLGGLVDDELGALDDSEREIRESVHHAAASRDDETEAGAWNQLVEVLTTRGKHRDALAAGEAAEAALARARSSAVMRAGLDRALSNAAAELFDYDTALAWSRKSLQVVDAELERTDPSRGSARINLAARLNEVGRPEEALPLAEEGLAILESYWGTDHHRLVWACCEIGRAHFTSGHYERAIPPLERARTLALKVGRGSTHYVYAIALIARTESAAGHDDKAFVAYDDLAKAAVELGGKDDERAGEGFAGAAMIQLARGRLAEAEAGLREALRIYRAARGNDDLYVARTLAQLSEVAAARNARGEAIGLLEEAVRIALPKKHGVPPAEIGYARAIGRLARLLWAQGPATRSRALAYADEAAGELERLALTADLADLRAWRATATGSSR